MRPEDALHALIAQKREELAALCRRYGVARLEVFGSAARGVDFDPDTSDADFLVEFRPDSDLPAPDQFFGFSDALEALLGRPVDPAESRAITNPFIRAGINDAREIVYAE